MKHPQNPNLQSISRVVILAACASIIGSAQANIKADPCGFPPKTNRWLYDACMEQSGRQSSNPITGNNGAGNAAGVPAKDPIKPHRPPDWPSPVTTPGAKSAVESGRGGPGTYPGQQPAKPPSAAFRACSAAAIKTRCKANSECIRRAQSDCADLAP